MTLDASFPYRYASVELRCDETQRVPGSLIRWAEQIAKPAESCRTKPVFVCHGAHAGISERSNPIDEELTGGRATGQKPIEHRARRAQVSMRFAGFLAMVVALAAALTLGGTARAGAPGGGDSNGGGGGPVIYDSTVTPLPGNLPSEAFQATQTSQFGDEIVFGGTGRQLDSVTVTMSSWACTSGNWNLDNCVTSPRDATFSMPITFTIYDTNPNQVSPVLPLYSTPEPGKPLATLTQTFKIPYRPSADDVHCNFVNPDTGKAPSGEWYDHSSSTCFNGLANNITFDFRGQNVVLPDRVVYGIEYNTSGYGPTPEGYSQTCNSTPQGCFYDSLNVGLSPSVTVGWQLFPYTAFLYSLDSYCDGGTAGVNIFRLDSPTTASPTTSCWIDATQSYIPAVQFTAEGGPQPPTDHDGPHGPPKHHDR